MGTLLEPSAAASGTSDHIAAAGLLARLELDVEYIQEDNPEISEDVRNLKSEGGDDKVPGGKKRRMVLPRDRGEIGTVSRPMSNKMGGGGIQESGWNFGKGVNGRKPLPGLALITEGYSSGDGNVRSTIYCGGRWRNLINLWFDFSRSRIGIQFRSFQALLER